MGKFNLAAAAKSIKGVLERHTPEILTGIEVADSVPHLRCEGDSREREAPQEGVRLEQGLPRVFCG